MESSLHRQLKARYAQEPGSEQEARIGPYRIDVKTPAELIEIQQANLAALRSKLQALLPHHRIRIVKPLVRRTRIVWVRRDGRAAGPGRWSPKRGSWLDFFAEWVHLARVFPHKHLTVEVVLLDIEEHRIRRPTTWRRRYRVADRRLLATCACRKLQSAADLADLVPRRDALPDVFDTRDLAEHLDVPRWYAQQIAYGLRHSGAVRPQGKQGNALRYAWNRPPGAAPMSPPLCSAEPRGGPG